MKKKHYLWGTFIQLRQATDAPFCSQKEDKQLSISLLTPFLWLASRGYESCIESIKVIHNTTTNIFISQEMNGKTIVMGVIGADAHAVGNTIIQHALTQAGYKVVNLGVMVSQEEYIEAAIETNADAILVSSLYGHGEIDCSGLREKCDEAGLKNIPLVAGGNLVVGKVAPEEIERRFAAMGFNKAYPPGTPIEVTIEYLNELLNVQ